MTFNNQSEKNTKDCTRIGSILQSKHLICTKNVDNDTKKIDEKIEPNQIDKSIKPKRATKQNIEDIITEVIDETKSNG